MILVYKFLRTEPNRLAAGEESVVVPKLVGEYADEAMAKPLIGAGEFAFYESQGDPDPKTGLYKSFKLQEPKAGPVAKIEAAAVETPKIRRKKKVGI